MAHLHLFEDARDWATKEMTYFERLFDLFLDRLILISDYFVLTKKITLTEMLIWWLSLSRVIWLICVNATSPYNEVMSNAMWLWVYLLASVAHTISFFGSQRSRAFAVCAQAFVWCMLGWVAAMSHSQSFALPTAVVLTFGSIFVAVRLFRDK